MAWNIDKQDFRGISTQALADFDPDLDPEISFLDPQLCRGFNVTNRPIRRKVHFRKLFNYLHSNSI